MKKIIVISVLLLYILSGCNKDDDTAQLSGTVTINNDLGGDQYTGYYAFGFSFIMGKKVSSLDNPPPDIIIDNGSTYDNLIFMNNNNNPSFYKSGDYPDAASAEQAYNALTSATVTQWGGIGEQVRPHQIWLYRTDNQRYAKLRIVSTNARDLERDFAECTFEWDYQPDGTLTFPGE